MSFKKLGAMITNSYYHSSTTLPEKKKDPRQEKEQELHYIIVDDAINRKQWEYRVCVLEVAVSDTRVMCS